MPPAEKLGAFKFRLKRAVAHARGRANRRQECCERGY